MDPLAKLMYGFKRTDDSLYLHRIYEVMARFINGVARKKASHSPTGLNSFDDMKGVAEEAIWTALLRFKFYCPLCTGAQKIVKHEQAYRDHLKNVHKVKWEDPSIDIVKYVRYCVGTYLQNEIKKEYSQKRQTNLGTVELFSPHEEQDTVSDSAISYFGMETLVKGQPDLSQGVIFETLLSQSINEMDELSKEIVHCLMLKMNQQEIAEKLHGQGRYKSVQSAAVMVSRTIKHKLPSYLGWLNEGRVG